MEKIEKEKIKNLESKFTSLKEKENSLLIKKEIMAKEKFDNELNHKSNVGFSQYWIVFVECHVSIGLVLMLEQNIAV